MFLALHRRVLLLILGATLGFAPLAHGQVAPSPQNAGFALADQIRANRTQSVTYAMAYQQTQQQQAMINAQTAANEIAAQQAAQPEFGVQPTPEGGVNLTGPVFGPGLVSSVPGGTTNNNITLQINIQNGTGNIAGNGTAATQTSASR